MSDAVCPWWLAYTFDNPLRPLLHDPAALLAPHVARGMSVLDAGCGMGFFSIALARLVGPEGGVVAVDVQQEMLDAVARRARKAGVSERIRLRRCRPDDLGVAAPVDFAVAFWVAHEVPDAGAFFRQLRAALRPGGKVLWAEPKVHVPARRFAELLEAARGAGLAPTPLEGVRLSRAALLAA